jgi:hypothetical protein
LLFEVVRTIVTVKLGFKELLVVVLKAVLSLVACKVCVGEVEELLELVCASAR